MFIKYNYYIVSCAVCFARISAVYKAVTTKGEAVT